MRLTSLCNDFIFDCIRSLRIVPLSGGGLSRQIISHTDQQNFNNMTQIKNTLSESTGNLQKKEKVGPNPKFKRQTDKAILFADQYATSLQALPPGLRASGPPGLRGRRAAGEGLSPHS